MAERRLDALHWPELALRSSHSTRHSPKADLAARLQFRAKSEMDMTSVGVAPELLPPSQPIQVPSPILRRTMERTRRMTSSLDTVTQVKPVGPTRKKVSDWFTKRSS